jgi:uncharacterized membrane protein YcgQ (UPF0703/DUF1980 family)
MKRIICLAVCLFLTAALTACGDKGVQDDTQNSAQNDNQTGYATSDEIDIDLTAMSGTMVYSEVYNMTSYPEEYIGKRVKMNGIFDVYYDEESGINYFACIIQDATACCAQGVEFEPLDSYSYPEDYPEDGDIVVVEGVFDTYEEDGYTYCTLRDAKFI